MTALIRTELLRLRTVRSTWLLLVVGLVLTLGWAARVITAAGGVGAPERGSTELRDALLGASGLGLFAVMLLGVVAVTGEFHHATITSTFLATPARWRVLVAKAVACALVGSALVVGYLTSAWTAGALSGAMEAAIDLALVGTVARSMLVAACWGLLGVAIGAFVRNQTVALLVPLVWFGIVESLVPAYRLAWLVPWLPRAAGDALFGAQFAGALPAWAALLVLLGYVAVLGIPGARAIARRDIT